MDDGSTDETFELLAALQAQDAARPRDPVPPQLRPDGGFAAGFAHARGRYIVTSDGDLQNDPRDIPAMIELAQELDIVAGWRKDRKDPFINRRLPSMIANWIISRVTGVKLHDYGCSLKVFRAEVVKPMKLYGEMHRFLPAIASEMGVDDRPSGSSTTGKRMHGTSNYGISRTIRVVLDLMTVKFLISYSTRPLQIFGLLGLDDGRARRADLRVARVREVRRTTRASPTGRCCCAGIVLIVMGVQFLMSGLLAEMQARTYHESQDKPTYVIREIREAPSRAPRGNGRMTRRGLQRQARGALVAAALVVAACGGSPSAPTPPSGTAEASSHRRRTIPAGDSVDRRPGTRAKEPANFADVGEVVPVSADGQGRRDAGRSAAVQLVRRLPGPSAAPVRASPGRRPPPPRPRPRSTLTLEVVERYGTAPNTFEHQVSAHVERCRSTTRSRKSATWRGSSCSTSPTRASATSTTSCGTSAAPAPVPMSARSTTSAQT